MNRMIQSVGIVGVLVCLSAAIVVVFARDTELCLLCGGEKRSFLAACSRPAPESEKAKAIEKCGCAYGHASSKLNAAEIEYLGALLSNSDYALKEIARKHGQDFLFMALPKIQLFLHDIERVKLCVNPQNERRGALDWRGASIYAEGHAPC
jgi:hypothetical protein